jgi:ornithine--oxo-acid transaminase
MLWAVLFLECRDILEINVITTTTAALTQGGQAYVDRELRYGAHDYHSLAVVLSRGKGVYVYDTADKQYLDFLAAYSAVNQGHCHPRIVSTLVEQSQKLTLSCRASYSEYLAEATEYLHQVFGYDKAIMINSGIEAVETSVKRVKK